MNSIQIAFERAGRLYNTNSPHIEECQRLVRLCLEKLWAEAGSEPGWIFTHGRGTKEYIVYRSAVGSGLSRPWLAEMHVDTMPEFDRIEQTSLSAIYGNGPINEEQQEALTLYVYTSVMAFSCCYDIWKPGSRKTPGTYFEVLMAALMGIYLRRHTLSKHVDLGALLGTGAGEGIEAPALDGPSDQSTLSTDLVLRSANNDKHAVIPLKITTRERIVQPFAHQRILDSAFPDKYRSFLCCISETQLDKTNGRTVVKQVCVPGTVKLFQRFLAKLDGLYYCDVPLRYAMPDLTMHIPVKSLGALFDDVKALLDS
jgi:hypothetical protein